MEPDKCRADKLDILDVSGVKVKYVLLFHVKDLHNQIQTRGIRTVRSFQCFSQQLKIKQAGKQTRIIFKPLHSYLSCIRIFS